MIRNRVFKLNDRNRRRRRNNGDWRLRRAAIGGFVCQQGAGKAPDDTREDSLQALHFDRSDGSRPEDERLRLGGTHPRPVQEIVPVGLQRSFPMGPVGLPEGAVIGPCVWPRRRLWRFGAAGDPLRVL